MQATATFHLVAKIELNGKRAAKPKSRNSSAKVKDTSWLIFRLNDTNSVTRVLQPFIVSSPCTVFTVSISISFEEEPTCLWFIPWATRCLLCRAFPFLLSQKSSFKFVGGHFASAAESCSSLSGGRWKLQKAFAAATSHLFCRLQHLSCLVD